MAKIVQICFRDQRSPSADESRLREIFQRLAPDNLTPRPPQFISAPGLLTGIFNPTAPFPIHEASVCLGVLVAPGDDWSEPGAEAPDGTYALFRATDNKLEIVTDPVATRTVWYAQTDSLFLAATSQRAIVHLLGSFEPQLEIFPWLLFTGSLGPSLSWDRRVKRLPGDARLTLDRRTWKLQLRQEQIRFQPESRPAAQMREQLQQAIQLVLGNLNIDLYRWPLTLSGGYDSRLLLEMLRKFAPELPCITWGLQKSLRLHESDAAVVADLAKTYHLQWRYLETDLTDEPIETVLRRFLVAGEGRIDHMSGYMDGFSIWRNLQSQGFHGVLRGDEPFGVGPFVYTEYDVRRNSGCFLAHDFANRDRIGHTGADDHQLPDLLKRRADETMATWRGRLYQQFKLPSINAALSDLKYTYLEVINPLLSRSIVNLQRTIPDRDRTNKAVLRELTNSFGCPVRYATRGATERIGSPLRTDAAVAMLADELASRRVRALFPSRFVDDLVSSLTRSNHRVVSQKGPLRTLATRLMPDPLRSLLRTTITKPRLDPNVLAFRVYTIAKMHEILTEDAKVLTSRDVDPT